MKLYIAVTQLSRFEALYRNTERLDQIVDRDTGIRWIVRSDDDVEELRQILERNQIKYQLDGAG